jgi:uncharacterized protein (TIGR02646 family)
MRQISPRHVPAMFTEWRAAWHNDINYGYELVDAALRAVIKDALIAEQRSLCAYTGLRVDASSAHLEHLLPQDHCTVGQEDVDYRNMVACYPGPNAGFIPFGATRKADWPSRAEQHLFVSPRSAGCESRFIFSIQGKIRPADGDDAARETVRRLGLDNRRLENLRKEAIDATLKPLDLPSARKRLTSLEDAENDEVPLEPFCFALKQALRKHIVRLESIRESRRAGRRR